MTYFNTLPTELQFNILSQSSIRSHNQHISEEVKRLNQYVEKSKLSSYAQDNLITLCLFSSNNKETNKKFQYSLQFNIKDQISEIQIQDLINRFNVLPVTDNTVKDTQDLELNQDRQMELVIHENQSFFKLFLSLMLNDQIIYETAIKVQSPEGSTHFNYKNKMINIDMDFIKSQTPSDLAVLNDEDYEHRNRYDYNESFKFDMAVRNLTVDNSRLVELLEKKSDDTYVVRY